MDTRQFRVAAEVTNQAIYYGCLNMRIEFRRNVRLHGETVLGSHKGHLGPRGERSLILINTDYYQDDAIILGVVLHEIIHAWQFVMNMPAAHDAFFYRQAVLLTRFWDLPRVEYVL